MKMYRGAYVGWMKSNNPMKTATITQARGVFWMSCRVELTIRALRVRVPGTDRVFTPRVSDVVPDQRMTWTGGFSPVFKGVRTFELRPRPDGSTEFVMEERFSGLMLPLVQRSLPDFGPVFERYASDLKHEAELCRSNSQGDEYDPRIAS